MWNAQVEFAKGSQYQMPLKLSLDTILRCVHLFFLSLPCFTVHRVEKELEKT